MTKAQKSIALICRRPPYGNSLAKEAMDIALAAAAFDQTIALFFIGDGVLQLLEGQSGEPLEAKDHGKLIAALSIYDIDTLYTDADALTQRGLSCDELIVSATNLDTQQLKSRIADFDILLSF